MLTSSPLQNGQPRLTGIGTVNVNAPSPKCTSQCGSPATAHSSVQPNEDSVIGRTGTGR